MALTKQKPFVYKWAEDGNKTNIPNFGADHITGRADLQYGFPKQTMTSVLNGGVPPWGEDHNGILYRITASLQWLQAGGQSFFDQGLCDKIGGYPLGVILQDETNGTILWFSIVDNNVFNPANKTQLINNIIVNRFDYWKEFSLKNIDDLEKTVAEHTTQISKKAGLNGDINQDFNANTLVGKSYVKAGSLVITGGVFTHYASLDHAPGPGLVRSWGINQIPNDNNIWQFVGFNKDDPDKENSAEVFIQFTKEDSEYNNKATVFVLKTFVAPYKGDLAELYEKDDVEVYVGQVMMIGGSKEITKCSDPSSVFGVYSDDPAFILNGKKINKNYIPIALTGRVPVLIEGSIKKNQRIMATKYGTATAWDGSNIPVLGRTLETNLDPSVKLVECFVKAVV